MRQDVQTKGGQFKMKPIEIVEYKGYQIKIYQDEFSELPGDRDNLGTMLCKHRDYRLGDVKESEQMTHRKF